MAAFRGRQAQCKGFHFDFVGYFPDRLDDSFLTRVQTAAQESNNHILGVSRAFDTNNHSVYFLGPLRYLGRMLRNRTRMISATKVNTLGRGTSCAII